MSSQSLLILDKKSKSWNEYTYTVKAIDENEAKEHEKSGAKVMRMWNIELPIGTLVEMPIWGLEE